MATFTNNNTGDFGKASSKLKKFVLDEYLAAKIANFMGVKKENVTGTTVVRVNSGYGNSEGVIKGYDDLVKGLRVDLQKAQTHNKVEYATWQVQWGTGMKKTGGAYAGVLMRTNTDFTFADFQKAMSDSFDWGKYCRLDP